MGVAAWALRALAHWSIILRYFRGLPDVDHVRYGLHDINLDVYFDRQVCGPAA